jgi:hypothetical protein
MKRDEFGLKPPHYSYVDMIEHMSDGVVVDVVHRDGRRDRVQEAERPPATGRESNRPSSRSNRGERD